MRQVVVAAQRGEWSTPPACNAKPTASTPTSRSVNTMKFIVMVCAAFFARVMPFRPARNGLHEHHEESATSARRVDATVLRPYPPRAFAVTETLCTVCTILCTLCFPYRP